MRQEKDHRQLRRFYEQEYYADRSVRPKPSLHQRRLAKRMIVAPETRLLDIACGTGEWLIAAADEEAIVSGVDIAARAIAIAADHLPNASFSVSLAEQLPFANSQFDLVSCLGALEHFPDKDAALSEMHRVLVEDGKALMLVPNAGFLTRRVGLFKGTEQAAVREDVLSIDAWQQLFERNGFRIGRRWSDLHVLSLDWLLKNGWLGMPLRFLQALALVVWPLSWQYQVYFLLHRVERR